LVRQDTVTDTFMSAESWNVALLSAGAVCAAVDTVMSSATASKKVFVTCRPPGHHAARHGRGEGATSQGFCLLNNVAIGALHATLAHNLERVLVFDADVHAGNGTTNILGGLSKILFCQILAPFDFLPDEENAPCLFGNVVNVLLSENPKRQASEMMRDLAPVFQRVRDFRPQLVLVSAGFDAHCADRVLNGGKGHLDQGDFERLYRLLTGIADEFCEGRLVAALEGGYSRRALQGGVAGMLTALLDADAKAERAARARVKRKQPDTKRE
jgi:acetoin utilization deacetylase AcuC-like enzyme